MAATKDDLRHWFKAAKASGFAYMVIMCDTFDWSDYPACYMSQAEAQSRVNNPGPGYKVMEVYDLSMNMEAQLSEYRAWHL